MKFRVVLLLICLFIMGANTVYSQQAVPQVMSYQGVLADPATGKFLSDGAYKITVRLYTSMDASDAIYAETQQVVVVRGVFNMLIGNTNPFPVSMKFDRAYFLGVSVNSGDEMKPRTPLTSSPYAMYAIHAGTADVAKTLSPETKMVQSVNNATGNISIKGSDGISVRQSGDEITIGTTTVDTAQRDKVGNKLQFTSGSFSGDLTGTWNTNANPWTVTIQPQKVLPYYHLNTSGASVGNTLVYTGSGSGNGVAWGAASPGGTAGGDLSGTYPNPTVDGLQGRSVSSTAPSSGQALVWNGSAWAPSTLSANGTAGGDLSGSYPNPNVVKIQNRDVSSTAPTSGQSLVWNGSAWTPSTVTASGTAGGDLSGSYPDPNVVKIQNRDVASTAPTSGQSLVWNGSAWAPSTVTANGTAGGDLSGSYPDPNVVKIQNRDVASTAPTSGQALVWNGSAWAPSTVTLTGAAGGDLTGTYPNPDIATGAVTNTKIANNAVSGDKIALGGDANGDIMYYNGTDYVRLAHGTDGQVLTISSNIPSWANSTNNTTLKYFVESEDTLYPNNSVHQSILKVKSLSTNADMILMPKGSGALAAGSSDTATLYSNGIKRGNWSVDWQRIRDTATQVASGTGSVLGGGGANTVGAQWSVIGGGNNNAIKHSGYYNDVIAGGFNNEIMGNYNAISGGANNLIDGDNSMIGGGQYNYIDGFYSVIGGGIYNYHSSGTHYSVISGGWGNYTQGDYTTILGGRGLSLNGSGSVGFLGSNSLGNNNMVVPDDNIALLGNVDLWLANNDSTARSLLFFSTNPDTGNFYKSSHKYIGLRSPDSLTLSATYFLPDWTPQIASALPGRILMAKSFNSSGVTMEWTYRMLRAQNTSVNCGSIPAGGNNYVDVTVSGAAQGGTVTVSPRSALEDGVIIAYSFIPSANTVRITFVNATSSSIDPASVNMDINIIQP